MKGYTFRFATSWLCSFSLAVTALSCGKSDSGSGPTTQASASGEDVQLNGAGSSFAFPILTQWFKDYRALHPNVVVEYAGTGSGAGITQFTAGNVDFGASDAAMSDDEISKVNGGVVMLPVTAGAIVIAYNLQGVVDLKLSRSTVAQIFVGKITKWSDPAIASNNPGVTLPDSPINVVHRADSSGTTFAFTSHLAASSTDWTLGNGKTVNWPAGQSGGNKNDGVTQLIQQTPGAVGYIEYGYAVKTGLATAQLENKAGKWVKATPESAAAALASVEMPANLRAFVPDPDGDSSYPIVSYTWLLCHTKYSDAAKGQTLKDVINYGLTDGQKVAGKLFYVPLPDPVVAKVKAAADKIAVGG